MSPVPLLFPPPLRAGGTIALVAPASPLREPARMTTAIERLRSHGFRVKPGRHLEKRDGYLAGSDAERAEDFQAAFADPEVDAVLALRGGYGSCRILPLLDYAAIRAHPKTFIGYSDITALQLTLLKETGLVTFHGPDASDAFLPANAEYFQRLLLAAHAGPFTLFSRAGEKKEDVKTVVPGTMRGPLLGGNMTCLLRLIGTPYAPDFRGAILFLEDTGEKAYRIDGMFTHLRLSGVLGQIGGLILGRFDHADEAERPRLEACLRREAERIGLPCVSGAPIGHMPEQIIVPQGAPAELDATAGGLRVFLG